MKEGLIPPVFHGANITGFEGGVIVGDGKKITVVDLGNNSHHTISEVDSETGAVVFVNEPGKGFQRLPLEVRSDGVMVMDGDGSPFLEVGETLQVEVGSIPLTIEATKGSNVKLGRRKSKKLTKKLEEKMYPGSQAQ